MVHPNGSKYWRLKYRLAGKEKTIALGVHGKGGVSLKAARLKAQELKKMIAQGIDPAQSKQEDKLEQSGANRFGHIAEEWIATKQTEWTDNYAKEVRRSLKRHVLPYIGDCPIDQITPLLLLEMLKRIENKGHLEMLRKVRRQCNSVFIYAKFKGLVVSNPAEGVEQVLKKHQIKNHNSIKLKELPDLLQAITNHPLEPTTKAGLLVALYTFQRTSEIRFARWEEIDTERALWTIPAERMKMRREHIIPLSRQALQAFESLRPLTAGYPFVFASSQHPQSRPMSENAMLYALYRMGFYGRMTVHGFRHLASTTLNELGFDFRWIEKQLSHEDRNKVRGTYNKAEYLPERAKMMQHWADFVDMADGSNVVPINSNKRTAKP